MRRVAGRVDHREVLQVHAEPVFRSKSDQRFGIDRAFEVSVQVPTFRHFPQECTKQRRILPQGFHLRGGTSFGRLRRSTDYEEKDSDQRSHPSYVVPRARWPKHVSPLMLNLRGVMSNV